MEAVYKEIKKTIIASLREQNSCEFKAAFPDCYELEDFLVFIDMPRDITCLDHGEYTCIEIKFNKSLKEISGTAVTTSEQLEFWSNEAKFRRYVEAHAKPKEWQYDLTLLPFKDTKTLYDDVYRKLLWGFDNSERCEYMYCINTKDTAGEMFHGLVNNLQRVHPKACIEVEFFSFSEECAMGLMNMKAWRAVEDPDELSRRFRERFCIPVNRIFGPYFDMQ